jgi:hypothetical protein
LKNRPVLPVLLLKMEGTMNKLQNAAFKFVDIIVLLTMVLTGPFNIAAAAAQVPVPVLDSDETEYAPGEIAHVTGAGFTPGDYALTAMGPDGTVAEWAVVTAGGDGGFASDSPVLDSEGRYEIRAYAAGSVDWSVPAVASVSFTVTAPAPTEPPTEEPTATEPPTEEPAATEPPTEEPTEEPTDEPTSEPPSEPELIPYIQSDKADYQPGELVTLTGGNWQGDTQARIFVNDDAGKTWSRDVIVDVAEDGVIVDSFNLPTWFVAEYVVSASGQQTGRVVTTRFTDSQEDYKHYADKAPANWQNGALQSTNSQYFEGEVVPHYWKTESLSPGQTYGFNIYYDYYDSSSGGYCGFDYMAQYNFSRNPPPVGSSPYPIASIPGGPGSLYTVGAGNVNVTGPYSAGIQRFVQVRFLATTSKVEFYWGLHLAQPGALSGCQGAKAWPGASLQTDVRNTPQFTQYMLGGGGSLQINPSGVIRGTISGFKWNDQNGSASPDGSEPRLSGWTIRLCADSGCSTVLQTTTTDGSGNYSFNVMPGTYFVREVLQSGWTQTFPGSGYHGPLAVAATTPTYANVNFGNRQGSSITIVKDANPNDPQDFTFDGTLGYFPLDDDSDPGLPNFRTFSNVPPGAYMVLEYVPSSWYPDGPTCTGDNGNTIVIDRTRVQIVLDPGENITCTFRNTKLGSITIVKDAIPDDAQNFQFSGHLGSFQLDDDSDPSLPNSKTFSNLYPNTFTFIENVPAGWAAAGISCAGDNGNSVVVDQTRVDVALDAGENITCTYKNTKLGSITIVKDALPDDPQDFAFGGDLGNFSLDDDSDPTVFNTISFTGTSPGTYRVGEGPIPSGWDLKSVQCTDPDNGTTISGGVAYIDLDYGENIKCVFKNTKRGTIIVEKQTDPEGVAGSFTFTGTVAGTISDNGQIVVSDLAPGTYSSKESDPSPTFSLTSISCDDGASATPSTFDLGTRTATFNLDPGEKVKCTFTNTLQQGTLTVIKQVENNNGGTATAGQWSIHVKSGGSDVAGSPQPGSEAGASYSLTQGTYNVSETGGPSGYTFTGFSGDCDASGNVTVVPGRTKTCTLTNDDQPGTLIVKKVVVNNNGGTLDADAFSFQVNGGSSVQFEADGQNTMTVNAGSYTVTEPAVAGYSTTYDNCTDLVIPNGGSATCTITNDDQAATLIVKKVVINDNSGTKIATDFSFEVNGGAASAFLQDGGDPLAGKNTLTVNAGAYNVTEPALAGYTTTYDNCSKLVIPNGGSATCTITNDDRAPSLTLVKDLVNDDGGDAVESDWTLVATGPTGFSGPGPSVSNGDSFDAGTYDLSESGPGGYTAGNWVCVGGIQEDEDTIRLELGESATCTITNDDIAPTLKLVKLVSNDDGGNATANDWVLYAIADAPDDGRNFSDLGGSGDFKTVFATTAYNLSEAFVAGYTAGTWSCNGGTLVGSTLTLTEGETGVTCTITNDDSAPTLTLIKDVVNDNGGNAQPDDFNLTIGGNPATSDVAYTLDANTPYAINETMLSGYTFVDITGDPECPAVLGGTVTLDEGENVTCTITNDDIAPTLTLIKNVVNDHGGNAAPDHFNLTIGGAAATSGTAYTLSANTPYVINETVLPGYSFVNITGDPECPVVLGGTVTLDEGDNVTCTITNNDQPAALIIIKHVVNDNGGTADAGDFTLDSGGTDDSPDNFAGEEAPGTAVTLDAGAYNVTETGPGGYSASFSADCSGTIANGETKTCTVTNDDIQPQLIVIKHVINDNGGAATSANFTMEVSGNNVNLVNFAGSEAGVNVALDAGSYSVSETGPAGYAPSFSADCTGSIDIGETKTCTITNNDISPTLTVVKMLLPGDDTGLFNLQIDGVTQAADVGDNGTTGAVAVNAGAHTIGESAGTGISLSDYVTTISGDCNPDGTVSLALAENKTCTITNVRRGSIVIVKNTFGGDGTFDFTSNTLGDFNLTTAGNTALTTFSGLDPASTYDVAETVPVGWELNSATCDNGETVDNIDLEPGETVTCTFENEKSGSIVIVKNTLGGDGTFDFTSGTLGSFYLTTAGGTTSTTFSDLDVDFTYDVSETVPAGWDLTSATCDNGETIDSIDLEPGETVTCTFTNTEHGIIVITKEAIPDDPQNFDFTATGSTDTPIPDFTLDDDADGTLPKTMTFSDLKPGDYTVTEALVAGWDLTGMSCASTVNLNSNVNVNLNTATATINLGAGDTVVCTFTNTKRGHIIVDKVTDPAGDPQSFSFDAQGGFSPVFTDFSLTDTDAPNDQELRPSNYAVTETLPTGWDLGSASCTSSIGDTETPALIELDPGETVNCTFTNIKRGSITVVKDAEPERNDDFTIRLGGDGAGNILIDDADPDDGDVPHKSEMLTLVPGTYTLTELDAPGWNLADLTCSTSDTNEPVMVTPNLATIALDPAEEVTCTFTNVREQGSITIVKNAIPGLGQDFEYTGTDPIGDFFLDDGAEGDSDLPNERTFTVEPGSYTVLEDRVPGWDLTEITCQTEDTSDTTSIDLTGGLVTIDLDDAENVICIFTNTKRGSITVVKDAKPDSDQDFTVQLGGDGAGNILLDDANPDDGDVASKSETFSFVPGNYTLTEVIPAGWDLDSLVCTTSGENEPVTVTPNLATINLDPGEEVTCTFTNIQRGTILVEKQTDPDGLAGDFTFTGTAAGTISDDGHIIVSDLVPGTYSSTESVPAGWQLTGITCDDANSTGDLATSTATFHLEAGETVKCTFTNDPLPSIAVDKVATPASIAEPGGNITFIVQVTNTSLEQITLTSLVDNVYGDLLNDANNPDITGSTCTDNTVIAAGSTYSCSFTGAVSGDAITTHIDTVTGKASDDEGNEATETGSATVTITDVLPTITVTKTADPTSVPETGGNVTFTFVVTNTSVEAVEITSLSDSVFGTLAGDADCQVGTVLPVGGACDFAETHFISGDFESGTPHTNVFTAHAEDNEKNDTFDDDDATVTFTDSTAQIDIEKYVSVDGGANWLDADTATGPSVIVGQSVQFKFVVTNTGNTALSNLSLVDTDFDLSTCTVPATLAAGASFDCIITTTALIGQHTDTATASGSFTDGAGNTESASDTDNANYFGADPKLGLTKSASPTIYTYPGQVIVYTYVLQNTGNVALTGPFMISDDKLGTFQCGAATSLAPGTSLTCTRNYTIQADDVATDGTLVTSLPNGLTATVTYGMWMQGSKSIMDITLSGLSPASGMLNGVYAGWCIQDHIAGQLKNQPAKLYSSLGSGLPADSANLPWNKINYVLNHKIRGAGKTDLQFYQDVQTAIWLLLGEPKPDWGISSQAQQMVNAANANPNYVPGNADVVAVLVYSDGMGTANPNISKQEAIIEVAMASITNKATATAMYGTTTVTSNQAQVTINQVASTAQITQNYTSCQMFRAGTSRDLTDEYYTVLSNKIINVAPGVFFYYSRITAPSNSFTFRVQQSNNSALNWGPIKVPDLTQVVVWKADCTKLPTTATYNATNGTVTINVSGATTGATYYVGIRYNPSSLIGKSAVGKPTVKYTFISYLNGAPVLTSWDGLTFKPK